MISVGANNIAKESANLNSLTIKDNYSEVLCKPTILAPGKDLYGFSCQSSTILDSETNQFLNGTSYSAPIVTGIIALLLEEFPFLKQSPEKVQSVLINSEENGIIDYQKARLIAQNCKSYTITTHNSENDILFEQPIYLDQNEEIKITNFLLFNGALNTSRPYIELNDISFSKISIIFETNSGIPLQEITSTKSNATLSFKNDTLIHYIFRIKIKLVECSLSPHDELASISYLIKTKPLITNFDLNNAHIDNPPTVTRSSSIFCTNNSINIVFCNYRNQICLTKNQLPSNGSLILSLNDWDILISLRGKEFYACISGFDSFNNNRFYLIKTFNEPQSFNNLYNINPIDFNFPEEYNNSTINSQVVLQHILLDIERLRCGYIEEQYINLSSKKIGTGNAYLQIEFNITIFYCTFGITLRNNNELLKTQGDSETIEIKNNSNEWVQFLDLLEDINLPSSRKDICRLEVFNIKGIRFITSSTSFSDRNKGRLCIDNIAFTDDETFNNFPSFYYEPIVIRDSFLSD